MFIYDMFAYKWFPNFLMFAVKDGAGNQERTMSILDWVIYFLTNAPLLSDMAWAIVNFFPILNLYSYFLIPSISFTIIVLLTVGFFRLMKIMLQVVLVVFRFSTKGGATTGRFATFWEVYKNYTVPSMLGYELFVFLLLYLASLVLLFLVVDMSVNRSLTHALAALTAVWFRLTLLPLLNRSYGRFEKAGLFPIGKYRFMNVYSIGGKRNCLVRGRVSEVRQSHTMMIGPTGSGKTSGYFIPGMINDAFNNCSCVVVEAKDSAQEDVFEIVGAVWASRGRKVMLFDPWSGKDSIHFNPLLAVKADFDDPATYDAIETTIDAIYRTYETERGAASGDAAYYVDMEKSLLRGLIYISLFAPEGQRNLPAIFEVVNSTMDNVRSYIMSAVKISNIKMADDVKKSLGWFVDKDNGREDLKASTLRGLAGKLSIFADSRIKAVTVNNELDLEMLFKEPSLLCIKAPLNTVGASTMASIIIRFLMMKVPKKQSYGLGEDFKFWFYLSELPSLSIPKLDQFAKTARSSGTGIIAEIQDRADIAEVVRLKLGISSVDALLANFRTKIILPGCQPATAKFFSDAFGEREVKERRTIIGTGSIPDFKYQTSRSTAKLITSDNIQYMGENKALIVDSIVRPFFVRQRRFYNDRQYKKIIKQASMKEWRQYKPDVKKIEYTSPGVYHEKQVSRERFKDLGNYSDELQGPTPDFQDGDIQRPAHHCPDVPTADKREEKAANFTVADDAAFRGSIGS